jgi:peptidoglycan/LPS O-acetylase OafA/YrhL
MTKLLITCLLALASWRLIESPLLRLKKRLG